MARAISTDSEFSDSTTWSGERWGGGRTRQAAFGRRNACVLVARGAAQEVAHPAALLRLAVRCLVAPTLALGRAIEVDGSPRKAAPRWTRRSIGRARRPALLRARARPAPRLAGATGRGADRLALRSETSEHAAGFGDDVGQFLQRIDLLADRAPDRRGRFLGLDRHVDRALLQFGARLFELAADRWRRSGAYPRSPRRSAWSPTPRPR